MATGDKTVSMNDHIKHGTHDFDLAGEKRLGFVLPTYDWDFPWVVTDFLKAASFKNIEKECYIYAVFTCGKSSGYDYETLSEILSKKGHALSGAFAVSMPDTYIPMFPLVSEEEQREHLSQAEVTLGKVLAWVLECEKRTALTTKPPKFMYRMAHKIFVPKQKKVSPFWVKETCIGCGLCETLCPQNIIQIKDGHPVWTEDKCACCLACLHRCPQQAIQYGKKTEATGRYVNPNVRW